MDTRWFLDPIQNHYADFEGRATRQQFWMYVLWYFIGAVVLDAVTRVLHLEAISFLYFVGLLVPSIAIGARRLHDTGKSGWWMLLALIPLIGNIILIVLYTIKSDVGANKYGAPVTTAEGGAASEATVHDAEVVHDTAAEPIISSTDEAADKTQEKKAE